MTSVSVVIPTHNRAELLLRAVESVRGGAEVVVVDDGSTDRTPKLAKELAALSVTYRRLERSRGPAFARNAGAGMATGDLILFLDDDDVLLPSGAERILDLARRRPGRQLFLHNCVYPDGRSSISHSPDHVDISFQDWIETFVGYELKPVARRSLFQKYRFVDTRASGEGLLWGQVIREHGATVGGTPIVLYDTETDGRLTSPAVLLDRVEANAEIASRWLDQFGADLLRHAPPRYRTAVRAAVAYNVLADRRETARRVVKQHQRQLGRGEHALLTAVIAAPRPLLARLFLLQRGEWRAALVHRPLLNPSEPAE